MRLVIIGGGGHGRVVAEAAALSGLVDLVIVDPQMAGNWPLETGRCVETDAEAGLDIPGAGFVVAIGNNKIREKLYEKYSLTGARPISVLHPAASVSPSAKIGEGAMIMAGAVVGPLADIGPGVIVNHGAIAEHDTVIGAFSHLAPGAVLAGGARAGKRCFLGANSCVRHGAQINNDVVLGHGAVATRSIAHAGTYVGNPARPLVK